MEGAAGVGVFRGPAHWNTGLPLTAPGRVTEQVRETDSPAVREEVEGERKIIREPVGRYVLGLDKVYSFSCLFLSSTHYSLHFAYYSGSSNQF